jgi:hypothetical protein
MITAPAPGSHGRRGGRRALASLLRRVILIELAADTAEVAPAGLGGD